MSEDVSRNAPRYVFDIQQVLLRHNVQVGAESAIFAVADGAKRDTDLRGNLGRTLRRIMASECGRISADELLSLILMASACPVNRLPSPKMEQAMYETLGFILEARRPVEDSVEEVRAVALSGESEAPVVVWQARILAGSLEEVSPGRSGVIPVVAFGSLAACLFAGVALHRHHSAESSGQLNPPSAIQHPSDAATRDESVVRGLSHQVAVRPKGTPSRPQGSDKKEIRRESPGARIADVTVGDSHAQPTSVAKLRVAAPSANGTSSLVNLTTSLREGVSHPPSPMIAVKSSVAPVIAAPANSAGRSVAASAPRELVHSGSAGVMAANLISSPTPAYPREASAAQIEGEVTVNALVGKDGNVLKATVVSGPPLLREAALRAVEKWQYQPYLVSGKPAVVATTAIIEFELGRD